MELEELVELEELEKVVLQDVARILATIVVKKPTLAELEVVEELEVDLVEVSL